jgi:glycopeptide antibiotics resistance protein
VTGGKGLVGVLVGAGVLALTMGPSPGDALIAVVEWALSPWRVSLEGDGGWAVIVAANVVLFVPVGIMLAWWRPAWSLPAVVLAGLGVSIGIELTQALVATHRQPLLVDVVANTAGAALGGFAMAVVRKRRAERPYISD